MIKCVLLFLAVIYGALAALGISLSLGHWFGYGPLSHQNALLYFVAAPFLFVVLAGIPFYFWVKAMECYR